MTDARVEFDQVLNALVEFIELTDNIFLTLVQILFTSILVTLVHRTMVEFGRLDDGVEHGGGADTACERNR